MVDEKDIKKDEAPADAKAKVDKPAEEAKTEATSDNKKDVKVPAKFRKLVEEIEQMSVLDLSELVSILEDKFGVSAAAPTVAVEAGTVGGDAGVTEEKSSFNVELTAAGDNKIGVIKAVKEITGLGLKEAKDMVDGVPKLIKEEVAKEEAEEIKNKIQEAGGTVTFK